MSILDFLKCKDRIDHGLHCSFGQSRHNLRRECIRSCDLLLQGSRTHHRADDVKTFAENLIKVNVSLTTGDSADEDDPALQCHRFETGGEIRTTIQIEYDIKATTAGYIPRKSQKVRERSSRPQTEFLRAFDLVGRTRCAERSPSQSFDELCCGEPDSTPDRMNQNVNSSFESRLSKCVMRSHEDFRNRARVSQLEIRRHCGDCVLMSCHKLSMCSTTDNPHHAITFTPAASVRSRLRNFTREFEPRDVLRHARRRSVSTSPLQ